MKLNIMLCQKIISAAQEDDYVTFYKTVDQLYNDLDRELGYTLIVVSAILDGRPLIRIDYNDFLEVSDVTQANYDFGYDMWYNAIIRYANDQDKQNWFLRKENKRLELLIADAEGRSNVAQYYESWFNLCIMMVIPNFVLTLTVPALSVVLNSSIILGFLFSYIVENRIFKNKNLEK